MGRRLVCGSMGIEKKKCSERGEIQSKGGAYGRETGPGKLGSGTSGTQRNLTDSLAIKSK